MTPDNTATFDRAADLFERGEVKAAARMCLELCRENAADRDAHILLANCHLELGSPNKAVATLQHLAKVRADDPVTLFELASVLAKTERLQEALERVSKALTMAPGLSPAWFLQGDLLVAVGRFAEAKLSYERAENSDPFVAELNEARQHLAEGRPAQAKTLFESVVKRDPHHSPAILGLASLAISAGEEQAALELLRLVEQRTGSWPRFLLGKANFLVQIGSWGEAAMLLVKALKIVPNDVMLWNQLATCAELLGDYERAREAYRRSLQFDAQQVRPAIALANIDRITGETARAIAQYEALTGNLASAPEAWWSLANLKTYVFDAEQHQKMQLAYENCVIHSMEREALGFALAAFHESQGNHAKAFEFLVEANATHAAREPFDRQVFESFVEGVCQRSPACADTDSNVSALDASPIFIVGLPRSGSTLLESILSAHSQVESTMELPFIGRFASLLRRVRYDQLSVADIDAMRRDYLMLSRPYRSGKPFFIDKMPNNFLHIDLIRRLFPESKIIHIERDPLDNGFSLFKQRFASGQTFAYCLADIGIFIRGYQKVMAHFNRAYDGHILNVSYENLVRQPVPVIDQLLRFCELPVEAGCYQPHEVDRHIRTPSSEQVRQPINATSVGAWQNYRQQLSSLMEALEQTS